MVFSFDIFDTVLTRCVASPRDVFFLMKMRLLANNNSLSLQTLLQDFPFIRRKAEASARARSRRQDIKISDIYEELSRLSGLGHNVDSLIDEEIAVERGLLHAVIPVCQRIKALYNAGERVIFISDMYLPAEVLVGFLNAADIPARSHDMYVSGEIGLRKLTGSLYRHVLKAEKIQPNELFHFGDNMLSDVFIPWTMGVHVSVRI